MKLAVTDACIFIDLLLLDLVQPFFNLNIEIHTSLDVFYELNDNQRGLLSEYQIQGKLTVHTIHHADRELMREFDFPRSLGNGLYSIVFVFSAGCYRSK